MINVDDQINLISDKPGCYLFYNSDGKVIYVGKAKRLRRRVSSYFKKVSSIKTMQLVRNISEIKTFITENEQEALILEQNLIKKYKPRFNIVLNDDKQYPYIVITNEPNPQYRYLRKYDKNSLKSFGPLPDGTSAREILKMLERIYPLRRCAGDLGKPCLYFHIQQCSGACFKEVSWEYYQDMINHVDEFFQTSSDEVKEKLTLKMTQAADNLQFEEANRIKKLIEHLNFSRVDQEVDLNDNLNRDVVASFISDNKIAFAILFYRQGKLVFKDDFVGDFEGQDLSELYESYLSQIYSKNMLPDYILVDEAIKIEDFANNYNNKLATVVGETEKKMLNLAMLNAQEVLRQSQLSKSIVLNNETTILKELQEMLDLPSYPHHIEIFDVANIMDEFVLGAMVVFKGGKPSFNDFRKYNIEIEEKGDYQRFQNMIYRRYQKALRENQELPDLIIADGGIIQVNAILSQLEILDLKIPVIGLVKDQNHRTDHILDLNKKDFLIPQQSPVFNFLKKLQDRVHNFAIAGFRKNQAKSLIQDVLKGVPLIGATTIAKIRSVYPTLSELKGAKIEDLEKLVSNKKACENLISFIKNLK
ncbi:excinuclease ABC subunit UvrC [Spiroplasma alleghenense]|uniref:UvrABC system protein C n=1 Tax=Spiroplasma alleghenense TaxID=216931 RepID=A0A345Z4D9_9MOLU|nr:excinuclease ABC subunit UvrC [Spiroplasma alleghenense]AXK51468.1 excinuclease ABC subunit C [Spiroplasma alleghenense]